MCPARKVDVYDNPGCKYAFDLQDRSDWIHRNQWTQGLRSAWPEILHVGFLWGWMSPLSVLSHLAQVHIAQ